MPARARAGWYARRLHAQPRGLRQTGPGQSVSCPGAGPRGVRGVVGRAVWTGRDVHAMSAHGGLVVAARPRRRAIVLAHPARPWPGPAAVAKIVSRPHAGSGGPGG